MTQTPAKILVVDDDRLIRLTLEKLLTRAGHELRFAENGVVALERVAEALPDLILLDIRMPGLDGRGVCEKLSEQPETQNVPIIFLTAEKEAEDIVLGLALGAVDYVPKPFDGNVLLARISGVLNRAQKHKGEVTELRRKSQRLQVRLGKSQALLQIYRLLTITLVLVTAAIAGTSAYYFEKAQALRAAMVQKNDTGPSEADLKTQMEQALALIEAGRPQAAIPRFNELLQRKAHYPDAVLGLARARATLAEKQARRGEMVPARQNFRIAQNLAGGDPLGGYLEQVRLILESVGSIDLVSSPPGALIALHAIHSRSGALHPARPLGRSPLSGRALEPGNYLLVVTHPGYLPARLPIQLKLREKRQIKIEMIASKDAPEGMVHIPAGPFWHNRKIGDPLKLKTLPGFLLDRTEVTHAAYARFLIATKRKAPPAWKGGKLDPKLSKCPVYGVSWHDADAYARWAGKRLPSEAEWQKAARAGDKRIYPWGNQFTPDRANVRNRQAEKFRLECAGGRQSGASLYGVLQMAGNLQEWTASDAEGEGYKALRGGSWVYKPHSARCDFLVTWPAKKQFLSIGFRCAKDQ